MTKLAILRTHMAVWLMPGSVMGAGNGYTSHTYGGAVDARLPKDKEWRGDSELSSSMKDTGFSVHRGIQELHG